MRKLISLFIFMLIPYFSFAAEVSVEVNPPNPLKDENFQLIFKVKSPSNSTAYISFDPGFAQVLGKRSSGVSISTTIVNGRVSTVRESSYIFEMIAPKNGRLTIKDISVDIDGKKTNIPNKYINIASTRKTHRNYFLVAELSNSSPFIGEGFNVDYYLYYRYSMSIIGHEILKFPTLNNFIKRFYMPTSKVETVEKDGFMYSRKLIYSARLYPEKEGKLRIDPVKIRIQYPKNTRSGVGFFGFGMTRYETRDISSKQEEIEVRGFEGLEVPKNYSGLIGENNFRLELNRNKFMVNEAIELKLIAEGEGALEKMEAPKLLNKSELEEFDTKSNFEEINLTRARKTFEYTYLPRSAFSDPSRIYKISIFDPISKTFIEKEIPIPSIAVSGQAFNGYTNQTEKKSSSSTNTSTDPATGAQLKGILAPVTDYNTISLNWIRSLIYLIILILLGFLIEFSYGMYKSYQLPEEVRNLNYEIKQSGIDYPKLYRLLYFLKNPKKREAEDIEDIILESELSDPAKDYFSKALKVGEMTSFSDKSSAENDFHYEDKYFKELLGKIEKTLHNESIQ